jgi:hypothetical protein
MVENTNDLHHSNEVIPGMSCQRALCALGKRIFFKEEERSLNSGVTLLPHQPDFALRSFRVLFSGTL